MFSKRQKRVCRVLPVDDKLQMIKRIHRGEKMSALCKEYGIGRTTIHDIYKNRARIQEYSQAKIYRITNRQSLRRGKNPRMEEALYEWYMQEKKTGTPINSQLLITRAKEIYNEIFPGDNDFPASTGWMTGFKRRYKIRFSQQDDVPVEGEKGHPEIEEFKNTFFRKLLDMELCPSQVYVASESVFCWRVLLSDGFNRKYKKDKAVFLSCTNASGLHKLKLLLVGNASHGLTNVNLPLHYFGQKIARITEESLKTWFEECFVAETRSWLAEHNLPPKALLVVNQSLCPSEEFTTEDDFSILFYPSECKDSMPLDESVMKIVKQSFRRHLLLTASSRDTPIYECLQQFDMKDMAFTLTQSWQSLPATTITASWKGLWDNMVLDMESAVDDNKEEFDPMLLRSVAEDTMLPVDILQKWFAGEDDHAENMNVISTNPDENISPTTPLVTQQVAVSSFDICIQWAEQNDLSSEEILLLRKLRDKALISKRTIVTLEGELLIDESQVFADSL